MPLEEDEPASRSPFPILMYHSVSSAASRGFRPFTVSPEKFEEHIRFIRESGYRSWTVSGLMEALKQDKRHAQNAVLLTFDDGFEDFHSAALPVLMRHGVTATLYVTAGYAGGSSEWLSGCGEAARPMLSWKQIGEISALGIEIGAHTMTHPALDRIPKSRAREEIRGSKSAIEDRLRTEVQSFAYPYGFYNEVIQGLVEDAGYESACAVRYAMSSAADDRFALSRHIVRHGTDRKQLEKIMSGNPPFLPLLCDRARSQSRIFVRQTLQGMRQ